jgi:sialate O-acetylesterase
MKMKSIVFSLGMAFAVPLIGWSDVTPSALFTDGMVIQRETKAPVWGTADVGEKVTVTASWGKTAVATADASGKWSVKLQTPSAGGPHTLSIQGNNTIEIKDVLSGEVWFCSGQSNMDFEMKRLAVASPKRTTPENVPAANYIKKEMETAKDNLLRQFTVTKATSPLEPLTTLAGSWMDSSPQHNPDFSATAYFFGRELRKELNVPVGLIKCAWGGTKVEPWIPAEAFQQDKEMAAYFESNRSDLENKRAAWDPEQAEVNYQAAVKRWNAKQRGRKPKKTSEPKADQQFPSTLFNAMVNPVIPYAIRGTIWYQGESNAGHNTLQYETNFRTMISSWREQWGQGDFPFYFVQLANYRGRSRANYQPPAAKPVEYHGWPSVCDQQRRTLSLKNTGMAVLSDIGEPADVHPHNKMDVGKRLALWALKNDYNQKVSVCSGPLYKRHNIKGDQVFIQFDSAGSGLMAGSKVGLADTQATDEALNYFQICGADRQWQWANVEITDKDTIAVSHPDIANPTVVRYAWSENAESANLYNKEGLPASIFTTEAEIPSEAGAVAPSLKLCSRCPRTGKCLGHEWTIAMLRLHVLGQCF